MSNQAPKFLLGGVNFAKNFLGRGTIITASYGMVETAIKVAPVFILLYSASIFIYSSNKLFNNR
jgi:hypothetical protein